MVTCIIQSPMKCYIQGGKNAENSLSKLEVVNSKYLSTLFADMLEKKYPYFDPDSFNIDNIMDWKLWPGFMKLYGLLLKLLHQTTPYLFSKAKSFGQWKRSGNLPKSN